MDPDLVFAGLTPPRKMKEKVHTTNLSMLVNITLSKK